MKRCRAVILWVGLSSILILWLAACAPAPAVCAVTDPGQRPSMSPADAPAQPMDAAGPSCANPQPAAAAACAALAERALASTVRLEFHGPAGGIGHGTVLGGRYILTHNHFPVSGEALSQGAEAFVTAVSVFRAGGDLVLYKVPLACFTVRTVDEEILVLDFGAPGGVGFFDKAGIPSAETLSRSGLALQPGSEVAQIDWDGITTHVDWARVVAVHEENGLPYVELDSFVEHGASGGGVFLDGRHIGNNWMRCTIQFRTGEVTRRYSVAALNR